MRILFIGGTVFVGRHMARVALDRGHEATIFHRGETNRGVFDAAEELIGDRDGGLDALKGQTWDAVIDTCGYFPRVVRASAEFLREAVKRYVFVSTISVYADRGAMTLTEESELDTTDDPTIEEITGESYGPLKVLCEQIVQELYGNHSLIIRPGLIVGPHDKSDRFTYWVDRFARGGEVLCPDTHEQPTQFIDVRDLAEWTVDLVEQQANGVYHVTGPEETLKLDEFFLKCRSICGPDAKPVWVSDEFLLDQKVAPWSDLPLWMSSEEAPYQLMRADCSKAIAAGLTYRPLEETITDTLRWSSNRPQGYNWRAGISPEREAELLEAWANHQK
jgi:2'-hydroxyisoflavone reductase